MGIFASNNGDTLAEFFSYQNAGRCLDKAFGMFSYCQSPQTDTEHNVFIHLSLDLGFIAATKGLMADVKRYLKQCVDVRATHPAAENAQSAAHNCLNSIIFLETNHVSAQVIKTLKEIFQ